MRVKRLVLLLAALALVAVLAACGASSEQGSGDQGSQGSNDAPEQMNEQAEDQQVAPQAGRDEEGGNEATKVEPPSDTTMKLTVPKMSEIKNDTIPTGLGTDETLFRENAGVHLKYSGYPWEEEANVYIAGHRLGYPGTNSDKAFYDLEDLKNGDKAYITDADGRRYTYEVFNKLVVGPTDLSVLAPLEGRNILSLQSCTLPDYSERVIYQARLQERKGSLEPDRAG